MFIAETDKEIQEWRASDQVEMKEAIKRLTFNIAVKILFGESVFQNMKKIRLENFDGTTEEYGFYQAYNLCVHMADVQS